VRNTGWPNVTHDGDLMYANTYSTDKGKVIEWCEGKCRVRHPILAEEG